MGRVVGWGLLAGALVVVSPKVSRADDAATAHEAQVQFDEGIARLKENDYEAARVAFARAYTLSQRPTSLWNLALAEEKTSHLVEALGHFKEFVHHGAQNAADTDSAQKHVDALKAQVGHIEVQAPSGAQIVLDGSAVGLSPLAEGLDVAPGHHQLSARESQAAGPAVSADPGPGQTVRVRLAVPDASAVAPLPPPPPTVVEPLPPPPTVPPPQPSHGFWTARNTTVVVVGGVAVVAGALGLAFGLQANSDKSTADSLAAQGTKSSCSGVSSPTCSDLASHRNSQHDDHVASEVLWIGAGALAAGAIVTLLVWPRGSNDGSGAVHVVPSVGAGSAGLTAVGSF